MPIRKIDGTGLDPGRFKEVRKGDGTTLSEALGIPESEADNKLAHRWVLDDVNGTVVDTKGDSDGTNNGVISADGDFAGGSAGAGDGVDDFIDVGADISFQDVFADDGAVAFTVETEANVSEECVMGADPGRGSGQQARIGFGIIDGSDGELEFFSRDLDGDDRGVTTDATFGSGIHRVVVNITGSGATDVDFWVDQSEESITVNRDDGGANDFGTLSEPMSLFAFNRDGDNEQFLDGILDDVCLFDEQLTGTEIQSYNNPF